MEEEISPYKSYNNYAYAGTEKHVSTSPIKKDFGSINKKKNQNMEYKTTHERFDDNGEEVYLISSSIDLNLSSKNHN